MSQQYTYNKYGPRANASANAIKPFPRLAPASRDLPQIPAVSSRDRDRDRDRETARRLDSANDYTDNYVHTGRNPVRYIRNIKYPAEGYPKLSKLHLLKRQQTAKHAVRAFGARVPSNKIVSTLGNWINMGLKFDVIMIGALVENQFIMPVLLNVPIYKLCARPGFLFVWSTTNKIKELTRLLNHENFQRKFRRLEELVFLPVNKDSPYYPRDDYGAGSRTGSASAAADGCALPLFEKQQWHCWMCITGTVKRSTDQDLIHCNVDTDLQIELPGSGRPNNNAVPDAMYNVAENFSNSARRLHIVPSNIGYKTPVKLRRGWVIMSPDVLINNFSPAQYDLDLYSKSYVAHKQNTPVQFLVPQTDEIEELRPKSPMVMG